jgi:hypothetical protein
MIPRTPFAPQSSIIRTTTRAGTDEDDEIDAARQLGDRRQAGASPGPSRTWG